MSYTSELDAVRLALHRPPAFPGGYQKISYPTQAFDLRSEATAYVMQQGVCQFPVPLEDLHLYVPKADQVLAHSGMSAFSAELRDLPVPFVSTYHRFVKYLAERVLGFDVVFEQSPPLRFHYPVPLPDRFRSQSGRHLTHHSDTLFGDYFEQINCWLPLTTCYGSSTLQMVSFAQSISILDQFAETLDYDLAAFRDSRRQFFEWLDVREDVQEVLFGNCTSIDSRFGELILFDARDPRYSRKHRGCHACQY